MARAGRSPKEEAVEVRDLPEEEMAARVVLEEAVVEVAVEGGFREAMVGVGVRKPAAAEAAAGALQGC